MYSPKKILVVEDELTHLEVMKSKLEIEGYAVIAAVDGEEGLRKIETEKPDLILLDVLLPKLDGFQVLEKMRQRSIKTPVIIVSNSGQPVEIDRALALGAKDYLVKAEFNPIDVVEKAAILLGKSTPVPKSKKSVANLPIDSSVSNVTLLIIEDDRYLRELIAKKLTQTGFIVLEAINGETGLQIMRQKKPRLLILDILLHGMNGFDVLRQIQTDSVLSLIPVIVLSNFGQQEDVDLALHLGAKDFLLKAHFTPAEVVIKVKETLNKSYSG